MSWKVAERLIYTEGDELPNIERTLIRTAPVRKRSDFDYRGCEPKDVA